MPLPAAFFLAAGVTLVLTPLAIRLAWSVGYLDHPEARKLHTSATALLGGVAVFLGALAAGWIVLGARDFHPDRQTAWLVIGAAMALVLGLWDDRFGMNPALKLAGQSAAAAAILATGPLPELGLPPVLGALVALVALAALMNAINFLDNMNGMVGGIAAIALVAFAAHSATRGAHELAVVQLALAGACAGFLPWNFPRARIFLGDAGSLLLGYSLGASAVLAFAAAPRGWGRLGPILMLAYPAFDMIFVVVNRLREGRKIYQGGKDHSNHRLASVIRCPTRTVLLLWLSMAALCVSGFVVLRLNRPLPALLVSGLWTILLLWVGLKLSSVPIARPPQPSPANP
jgi:UDP-GlcNAc:undecaprenyl-phosphate GlcNAc-1-phosphate transferase